MIILDRPYVSDFLVNTIKSNHLHTLKNDVSDSVGINSVLLSLVDDVVGSLNTDKYPSVYTNSENAFGWIGEHLKDTSLPEKINLFKNKVRFRDFLKEWHPNFFYKEVSVNHIQYLDISSFPFPFIIKPSVGFFSMGVYKVNTVSQWNSVKEMILKETNGSLYPREVFDSACYIIEECIEGDEFAFDAYFNEHGEPVILNILHHIFSSGEDVSDRIYTSSDEIIFKYHSSFTQFLQRIGMKADLRNFPLHVEVRVDKENAIQPIEINPLRFGGWCTTADMTWYAYGFNPYVYFFNQQKPEWEKILEGRENKIYSIIVLDNSTGIVAEKIKHFDYEKLSKKLKTPLLIRKVDHKKYNVFGFIFAETPKDEYQELEYLLGSSLLEFIDY